MLKRSASEGGAAENRAPASKQPKRPRLRVPEDFGGAPAYFGGQKGHLQGTAAAPAPAAGGEETAEAVVNRLIKGLRIVPLETAEEDKPEEVRAHLVRETAAVVAAGSDAHPADIAELVAKINFNK